MRCFCFAVHLLPTGLLISVAAALQLPDLQPFLSALPNLLQDWIPQALQNDTAHELLKRQYSNTCPTGFASCANLGAPQLCCMSSAVCSADYAGHVACCPSGAACTGTITGIVSSGTMNGDGVIVGGGAAATGTSNGGGLVGGPSATTTSFQFASSTQSNNGGLVEATTTGNGFIVAGSSTVATPGAGVRTADIPYAIKVVLNMLDYLPI
ncbi:hypothetical protein CLAFUW4_00678 [Fulvia fulva]|uniref:Uncharacterized protein n=1 Tax=Passalora fulva TaxID=5499 RepID=A0A9Q8P3F9_PASFU|nr:uncharacterized protein CLAFUR5_00681 [Fulvia fulva]KAK4634395.1 hypothetical protein CLAFUR4_00679 [Fulvia fulva]KAK4636423.1 hypothetical protein CLAFUR0_00680 [Fulvia fulva]UJO11716.1 hypothetical protein CLAFUR5_00681 [Fulvia fulva]WPV09904.1 hypothetical protein CLAFUW4_00678 [Fulvia fulva]WPV23662.1 hypothetical protein CLAFUW7_00683 [Fulvia fulva]